MKEHDTQGSQDESKLLETTEDLDTGQMAERLRHELKALLVTVSPDDFRVADIEEIVDSTSRQFVDTWMQREKERSGG